MSRKYLSRLAVLALMIGLVAVLAPSVGASPPALTGPWTGWYFNGILDSNSCFNPPATASRVDPAISFYWQQGTSPWPGVVGSENYTVCWQGTFNFPTSGNYTFFTFHDDGVRVWVPDLSQPLTVDAWYDTGPFETDGSSFVPAGWHKVVVAYYNHTNAGVACVDWALQGAANPLNCPFFPPGSLPPPPPPAPTPVTITLPPQITQQVINNIINNIINQNLVPKPVIVPPVVVRPPVPTCVTYQVRFGDTLTNIAFRFGTTIARLQADNGILNPNLIFVGQFLRVCH